MVSCHSYPIGIVPHYLCLYEFDELLGVIARGPLPATPHNITRRSAYRPIPSRSRSEKKVAWPAIEGDIYLFYNVL
jgi:hypothetical protein